MERPSSFPQPSPMIVFPQTPDLHFFFCGQTQCNNHITQAQEIVTARLGSRGTFRKLGVFKTIVNVHVHGPEKHRWIQDHLAKVADVQCKGCNSYLGWQFIETPRSDAIVSPGRFVLKLEKLLFWDGNQKVPAETIIPEENAQSD